MRIIGGKFKRRRFDIPTNITARPTTDFARENLFNVLNNLIDFEDISALDLFSGTGAISFELLSRGASRVVSVEKHRTQYLFQQKVARELKLDRELVQVNGDVFRYLKQGREQFDLIFADPPYDHPDFGLIPQLVLEANILKKTGLFVLEHSKKFDFSNHPLFRQKREYGSVNFSFFWIDEVAD